MYYLSARSGILTGYWHQHSITIYVCFLKKCNVFLSCNFMKAVSWRQTCLNVQRSCSFSQWTRAGSLSGPPVCKLQQHLHLNPQQLLWRCGAWQLIFPHLIWIPIRCAPAVTMASRMVITLNFALLSSEPLMQRVWAWHLNCAHQFASKQSFTRYLRLWPAVTWTPRNVQWLGRSHFPLVVCTGCSWRIWQRRVCALPLNYRLLNEKRNRCQKLFHLRWLVYHDNLFHISIIFQ